jgi:hypothetical protein
MASDFMNFFQFNCGVPLSIEMVEKKIKIVDQIGAYPL